MLAISKISDRTCKSAAGAHGLRCLVVSELCADISMISLADLIAAISAGSLSSTPAASIADVLDPSPFSRRSALVKPRCPSGSHGSSPTLSRRFRIRTCIQLPLPFIASANPPTDRRKIGQSREAKVNQAIRQLFQRPTIGSKRNRAARERVSFTEGAAPLTP